jgi:hypothetical protein
MGDKSPFRMTVEITLMPILAAQIVVNIDLTRDRSWSVTDDDFPSVTRGADRQA